MEKYNRWSDLTTGIHPFVPQRPVKKSSNLVLKGLSCFGSLLLCLLRIPLLFLVFVLLALLTILHSTLVFLPFVQRLIQVPCEWIVCRILLFLLGVHLVEEQANVRRLGLSTKTAISKNKGDLILANCTNFLEILYLASRYSPTFTTLSDDKPFQGAMAPNGLFYALYQSFLLPSSKITGTKELTDLLKFSYNPIAVFPEGTRSNGKAILEFLNVFDHLQVAPKVHVVCFRYEQCTFHPAFTTGNPIQHLLSLCCQLRTTMRVTTLGPEDVPPFPQATQSSDKQQLQQQQQTCGTLDQSTSISLDQKKIREWSKRIQSLMAAMLRSKVVSLNSEDFRTFHSYWRHVNHGGRQPASAYTTRAAPHEHAKSS